MKQLIVLLLLSNSLYAQQFGIRGSLHSGGTMISFPVKTATKGCISVILTKENDRHLAYVHYIERKSLSNCLSLYGGVGVHIGNRSVLNYKQDGNTIFLAGATTIGGVKLDIIKSFYMSVDVTPRVDFPFFGGCEMHKHCGEAQIGNINLSVGVNLK